MHQQLLLMLCWHFMLCWKWMTADVWLVCAGCSSCKLLSVVLLLLLLQLKAASMLAGAQLLLLQLLLLLLAETHLVYYLEPDCLPELRSEVHRLEVDVLVDGNMIKHLATVPLRATGRLQALTCCFSCCR
jgi:hypothetical protein